VLFVNVCVILDEKLFFLSLYTCKQFNIASGILSNTQQTGWQRMCAKSIIVLWLRHTYSLICICKTVRHQERFKFGFGVGQCKVHFTLSRKQLQRQCTVKWLVCTWIWSWCWANYPLVAEWGICWPGIPICPAFELSYAIF